MTASQLDYLLLFFALGFGLGVLMTWMFRNAMDRWKRGLGLMEVPEHVRQRHEEEIERAKNDRQQGCREVLRAIGYFLILAVLVFVVSVLISGLWR